MNKKYIVRLSKSEQSFLRGMVRRGKAANTLFRARESCRNLLRFLTAVNSPSLKLAVVASTASREEFSFAAEVKTTDPTSNLRIELSN